MQNKTQHIYNILNSVSSFDITIRELLLQTNIQTLPT